eukprot:scaffold35746_cov189-Skeletonema_dohrnii-CCMP3373.AAC.2
MARKRKDRTSIESAATVETVDTIDTVDDITGIPEAIGTGVSDSSSSDNVNDTDNSNETPRRKSPRQKKLLKPNFKGMQGSGSDEHYKVGRLGGAYSGKATMKRAPKSAV